MVNSAYWSRKFNKTLNISNAAPLKQVSDSCQIYPDPPGILSSVRTRRKLSKIQTRFQFWKTHVNIKNCKLCYSWAVTLHDTPAFQCCEHLFPYNPALHSPLLPWGSVCMVYLQGNFTSQYKILNHWLY